MSETKGHPYRDLAKIVETISEPSVTLTWERLREMLRACRAVYITGAYLELTRDQLAVLVQLLEEGRDELGDEAQTSQEVCVLVLAVLGPALGWVVSRYGFTLPFAISLFVAGLIGSPTAMILLRSRARMRFVGEVNAVVSLLTSASTNLPLGTRIRVDPSKLDTVIESDADKQHDARKRSKK